LFIFLFNFSIHFLILFLVISVFHFFLLFLGFLLCCLLYYFMYFLCLRVFNLFDMINFICLCILVDSWNILVGLMEFMKFYFVRKKCLSWKFQILVGCLVVRLFINCRYFLHLLFGLLVREFFFESEFLFRFFYIGGKMNLLLRLTLTTFFIEFRACVLLTSYLFSFILEFMEFRNSLSLVFFSKRFLVWICQIYLLETMGRKEYLNYINCCRH